MLEILALAGALQQQSSVHTVTAGETLSSIAGPNWPAVCAANGIANCNLIYAGQQINLGGGSAPATTGTSQADHEPDGDSDDPATSSTSQTGGSPGVAAPVTSPANTGGGLSNVPGVPQAFAACVAFRESTNGTNPAAHGNVYGIIPASGVNVAGDSIAQQKAAFAQLYAANGTAPWAPFDGC